MTTLRSRVSEVRRRVSFEPKRGVRLDASGTWLELPDALDAVAAELELALARPSRVPPDGAWGGKWLRRQLIARGASYHCFEPGFRVVRTSPEGRFVTDGTTRLWVREPKALRPEGAASGAEVALELPCGRPNLAPGFFTLVSRAGRPRAAAPVELFLAPTAEGALEAVDRLLLDRVPCRARFVAQVRDDEARLPATDGLTLLTEPADARPLLFWLRGLVADAPNLFLAETHPLAHRAGRGLGLAARPRSAPGLGGARSGRSNTVRPEPVEGLQQTRRRASTSSARTVLPVHGEPFDSAQGERGVDRSDLRPELIPRRVELLAQAVLRSVVTGSPVDRCVKERFSAARLDWANPALEPGPAPPWLSW